MIIRNTSELNYLATIWTLPAPRPTLGCAAAPPWVGVWNAATRATDPSSTVCELPGLSTPAIGAQSAALGELVLLGIAYAGSASQKLDIPCHRMASASTIVGTAAFYAHGIHHQLHICHPHPLRVQGRRPGAGVQRASGRPSGAVWGAEPQEGAGQRLGRKAPGSPRVNVSGSGAQSPRKEPVSGSGAQSPRKEPVSGFEARSPRKEPVSGWGAEPQEGAGQRVWGAEPQDHPWSTSAGLGRGAHAYHVTLAPLRCGASEGRRPCLFP